MRWIGMVMAALAGWTGGTIFDRADEVPVAVRQALVALAGPHAIQEIHSEGDDGLVIWEAQWLVDGVEHEAELLGDGTVLEHEFELSASEVPEAVRAMAEGLLSGDLEYEQVVLTLYEVDNGEHELLMLANGEVIAEESDDDDDDDDDD